MPYDVSILQTFLRDLGGRKCSPSLGRMALNSVQWSVVGR